MEVCLMSGLGVGVQAEVRLLRFFPQIWGSQNMPATSLQWDAMVLHSSPPLGHGPKSSLIRSGAPSMEEN